MILPRLPARAGRLDKSAWSGKLKSEPIPSRIDLEPFVHGIVSLCIVDEQNTRPTDPIVSLAIGPGIT